MATSSDRADRPLRILFFLYHAGYLRHYAEPVRLLAQRGHTVHLGFTVIEKDGGDSVLADRLAEEFPSRVTFGLAPTRRYWDGWRRTSMIIRAFTDLARYVDPRYEHAPALRERMAQKIKRQIFSGRADPVTTLVLARAADALIDKTDARLGQRLLRFLRAAERAIPPSRTITRAMRRWNPDAVLVTPLVEYTSNQVDFLKSARRLGIPTAACVASWDNLTNKGLLRFTPDRVLIWNELQRAELEELHGVPRDRAVVTGGQKFDAWFALRPQRSADDHRRLAGLPSDRPYVLYVCSSYFIAPDEVSFVKRLLHAIRSSADPDVQSLGLLVRPHPQNAAQWQDADLGDDAVAIWPRGGEAPDTADSRAGFYDSIHHSVAVVGVNTSAMIDSAIVGRNVMTILDPAFAATQEGTLHFHYLLRENGGFLTIARSLDEHVKQLGEIVRGGRDEADRVTTFVESFVRPRGIELAVAPIVADEIVDLALNVDAHPHRGEKPHILALRLALIVPTIAATMTLVVGAAIERLTGGWLERRRVRQRLAA